MYTRSVFSSKPDFSDWSDEVKRYLSSYGEPEWIDVLLCDVNGLLRHKRVHGSGIANLDQINIPVSTTMMDGQGRTNSQLMRGVMSGDPDRTFSPVAGTLVPVPWHKSTQDVPLKGTGGLAQIQISHAAQANDESYDPRCVLQRVLAELTEHKLYARVALELEFMVFEGNSDEPAIPRMHPQFEGVHYMSDQAYQRYDAFLTAVTEAAEIQGLDCPSVVKEYASNQFEINLNPSTPLDACDQAVRLKRVIKGVAKTFGWYASFMAKPSSNHVGNGLHAHCSFYTDPARSQNLYKAKDGPETFSFLVGGILATLPESVALLAPFANSFRRFIVDAFAPTRCDWGANHRAVAIRIPKSGPENWRLEHRVAGADACPYLLVACVIGGAIYGLRHSSKPGPGLGEGTVPRRGKPLPDRWCNALSTLRGGKRLSGVMDKKFLSAYLTLKTGEEQSWHAGVKSEELKQLFAQV